MGPERFVAALDAGRVDAATVGDRPATGRAGLFPQTMSILGNRWAFALLVAAFVGISRFTDFRRSSARRPARWPIGCRSSPPTACSRGDNRYRLTEKGRAFFPVLITALQWAQRWFPAPEGPAVLLPTRRAATASTPC